jgi:hypothetical protein
MAYLVEFLKWPHIRYDVYVAILIYEAHHGELQVFMICLKIVYAIIHPLKFLPMFFKS